MKRLLLLFLSLTLFTNSQEKEDIDPATLKHPVTPVLWKVEGKDLQKTSYLFGTIHLGDPRVTTLHPDAEKAFVAADCFYAEIDLDPVKQIALAGKFMRKDGKTLTESIGPDLATEVNAALKAINPVLDAEPFDPLKTWVLSVTLPVLELQMTGKEPLDSVLFQRAQKEKEETGALETADSQLKIFDDFKEAEQIAMLKSTLKSLAKEREEGKDSMQELLNLYLTGDIVELGDFIKALNDATEEGDKELTAKLTKKLFDDRNLSMTETIAKFLSAEPGKSHFFAVGAGHYTGATAIQDLLAKKGYTITPAFK